MRKFEINMGTVESIARATDNLMLTSAAEKGLFDNYVNSLNRLGDFIEAEENETAMNLLIQTATLLSEDARNIMKEIISVDASSVDIFLNYYYEYIVDGYVIDRILSNAEYYQGEDCSDDEDVEEDLFEEETVDDVSMILDEAYGMLKKCLGVEVDEDVECKGCCNM